MPTTTIPDGYQLRPSAQACLDDLSRTGTCWGTWEDVHAAAAVRSSEVGVDHGIERAWQARGSFGRASYKAWRLPRREQDRSGHEVRCEVVRPGTPLSSSVLVSR